MTERMVSVPVEELIDIVEGIGGIQHGTWRDEKGQRLKDTPAWTAFYVAARNTAAPVREEGGAEEEVERLQRELVSLAERLEYRGNSIQWIHSKMENYRSALGAAWDALRTAGVTPDGETTVAQAIAALATREEAPAEEGEVERKPCELELAIRELLWPYFESAKLGHFTHENDCSRAARQIAGALKPGFYLSRFLRAQPQAREEAQPVPFGYWVEHPSAENPVLIRHGGFVPADERYKVTALYTTPPAPEAEKLRVGEMHTIIMDAVCSDLMRQNPGAFTEEDGNSTMAIPTAGKPFLTIDVSACAEQAIAALQQEAIFAAPGEAKE